MFFNFQQKEREDIQKKLTEAQNDAEKSKVEVLVSNIFLLQNRNVEDFILSM